MTMTQLIAVCLVVTGGLLWLRRGAPRRIEAAA
jgi:hypothetical protein